jgi:hypothetical protein
MSNGNGKQDRDRRWRVDVHVTAEGDGAVATAELFVGDAIYEAHGTAERQRFSPRIGDELAVARALSALAHQLVESASREVDLTSRSVTAYEQQARTTAADLTR